MLSVRVLNSFTLSFVSFQHSLVAVKSFNTHVTHNEAKLAVAYPGISKWRAQLIINTIINFSNGTNDSQHKKPF